MSSIAEQVNAILINEFELSAEDLTPDADLREDLGLDSLDAVDLANKLEEQKDIQIEARALAELNTLGDVYALVKALTAKA
jgi:acyl carrier protein|tara:strand:- start:188 stop:430 length:243 start_codon:yes stop_codon:yes gene_type:complete